MVRGISEKGYFICKSFFLSTINSYKFNFFSKVKEKQIHMEPAHVEKFINMLCTISS